jgi:hypothetical protein
MRKMSDDQYSEGEAAQRREAAIKRLLSTPHKPHKPIGKKAKSRGGKAVSAKPNSV